MRKALLMITALGMTAPSLLISGLTGPAEAADAAAGKATVETVCAACHGANGISVSDDIPNLAGQKGKYLTGQLKAFRGGDRKNALMNAIASQLEDAEIENVAAFFADLPASPGQETSALFPNLVGDQVKFPKDFKETFTHYTTISFPGRKQVRNYYANPAAISGGGDGGDAFPHGAVFFVEVFKAKLDANGDPVTGDQGHFVADTLAAYTAMEKQPGWGDSAPEILRNGDWRYAVFTPEGAHKPGINEAKCLACHQPLDAQDYVFSIDALKEKRASAN